MLCYVWTVKAGLSFNKRTLVNLSRRCKIEFRIHDWRGNETSARTVLNQFEVRSFRKQIFENRVSYEVSICYLFCIGKLGEHKFSKINF